MLCTAAFTQFRPGVECGLFWNLLTRCAQSTQKVSRVILAVN